MTTLADLRKNYSLGSLDAADVDADPIRQFQTWLNQALDAKLPEPNAMTVATVDGEGRPAARILLIKGVDEHGFVFYTNYESRKGREDAVHLWALSRVGARVPLYGPLNLVVPASKVKDWITQLSAWDWPEPDKAAFPLAQLGRRTGDRSRDLDDAAREKLAALVRGMPGGDRAAVLVEQVVALEAREERVALGDTLPAGLRLVIDDERAPDDVAP